MARRSLSSAAEDAEHRAGRCGLHAAEIGSTMCTRNLRIRMCAVFCARRREEKGGAVLFGRLFREQRFGSSNLVLAMCEDVRGGDMLGRDSRRKILARPASIHEPNPLSRSLKNERPVYCVLSRQITHAKTTTLYENRIAFA